MEWFDGLSLWWYVVFIVAALFIANTVWVLFVFYLALVGEEDDPDPYINE